MYFPYVSYTNTYNTYSSKNNIPLQRESILSSGFLADCIHTLVKLIAKCRTIDPECRIVCCASSFSDKIISSTETVLKSERRYDSGRRRIYV